MSNMSYCRWGNTLYDLRDCSEHLFDDLGSDEHYARGRLLHVAAEMLEAIGADVKGLEKALKQFGDAPKTEIHVWPANEAHVASDDCACKPERDLVTPAVVVHNALDGRGDFETVEKVTKND